MRQKDYPTYTVVIRTLGTAGEKYLETLRSCERQIIQPDCILVYIPNGYKLPMESIGKEKYIRCDKGMVAQRSNCAADVSSDYILFLDDDLSFDKHFVQLLFDGLLQNNGDCISPDVYSIHNNPISIKVRDFCGGTWPHFNKEWSFRIRLSSHYSYNPFPAKDVLKSQSAAGACALCKKSVYEKIHFEDERWMDNVRYSLGDDQVFFYKIYKYGFTLLTSYNAKLIHLDAGAGHEKNKSQLAYAAAYFKYLIWHRTIFSENRSIIKKMLCMSLLILGLIFSLPLMFGMVIRNRSISILTYTILGYYDALKYVGTVDYKSIPSYYRGV